MVTEAAHRRTEDVDQRARSCGPGAAEQCHQLCLPTHPLGSSARSRQILKCVLEGALRQLGLQPLHPIEQTEGESVLPFEKGLRAELTKPQTRHDCVLVLAQCLLDNLGPRGKATRTLASDRLGKLPGIPKTLGFLARFVQCRITVLGPLSVAAVTARQRRRVSRRIRSGMTFSAGMRPASESGRSSIRASRASSSLKYLSASSMSKAWVTPSWCARRSSRSSRARTGPMTSSAGSRSRAAPSRSSSTCASRAGLSVTPSQRSSSRKGSAAPARGGSSPWSALSAACVRRCASGGHRPRSRRGPPRPARAGRPPAGEGDQGGVRPRSRAEGAWECADEQPHPRRPVHARAGTMRGGGCPAWASCSSRRSSRAGGWSSATSISHSRQTCSPRSGSPTAVTWSSHTVATWWFSVSTRVRPSRSVRIAPPDERVVSDDGPDVVEQSPG